MHNKFGFGFLKISVNPFNPRHPCPIIAIRQANISVKKFCIAIHERRSESG